MSTRLYRSLKKILDAPGLPGRILVLFLLLLPSQLPAETLESVLDTAARTHLAEDPTWLKLLHFESGAEFSSVLTDSFFLARNGRFDPRAELEATLEAYFEPDSLAGDTGARCRFPARYYWLDDRLGLPGYELRFPDCEKLENWALFDHTQSISLFLVAGYLGSPASTFGHSLIKLNSDSADDRLGLFDLTVSFGALVPEGEGPVPYIFRGLTGKYEAGFSDKYFYTQDLVYSRTEFRDMWDYRLALTEFQRTLMVLHIWEIVGRKFRYYFLEKNCAFRVAELLDLVIEEEVVDGGGQWYIPVDLFHRIKEIDRDRRKAGSDPLIESVRYVPSSRRKLHQQLTRLGGSEIDAINSYIESSPDSLGGILARIRQDRRALWLDGLLAYHQYQIIAERPDSTSIFWPRKDRALLARLRLASGAPPPAPIPELASPADGFRPMPITVGAVREFGATPNHDFARLGWSPFKKESIGQNSLEGNELVAFDLSVGISEDSPAVFLDQFDLIRILSLSTLKTGIRGEGGLSWNLRVGVDRNWRGERNEYDGLFRFGAGWAWQWPGPVQAYGLLNVEAHTDSPHFRIFPESGMVIALSRLRARLGIGRASTDYEGSSELRWTTRVMYRLGERHSVHVERSFDRNEVVAVGFSRYF